MFPLWLKLLLSFLLSALAIVLFVFFNNEYRKQCMLAMLLSTFGDLFMVDDFIPLGEYGTYIGAALFIAAHLVYAKCFAKMAKDKGYSLKGSGMYIGIAVMVVSTIVIAVFNFLVPEPAIIMFVLILVYIAVIGVHLCCNFAYGFADKGLSYFLPFAVLIFYLSDIFIFSDMLNIEHASRAYVWYLYPVAQLLLILFNSPLRKQDKMESIDRN